MTRPPWVRQIGVVVFGLCLASCETNVPRVPEAEYSTALVGRWQSTVGNFNEALTIDGDCTFVCKLNPMGFIANTLSQGVTGAVALVERRFRDGISAGDIPSDFPVAARASQVIDLVNGLTMRAKLGTARKTLLRDAEEAADLVLLPRGTSHGPSGSARKARRPRARPE